MTLEISDQTQSPASPDALRHHGTARFQAEAADTFRSQAHLRGDHRARVLEPGHIDMGSVASVYPSLGRSATAAVDAAVHPALVKQFANGTGASHPPDQPFHPFTVADIAAAGSNAANQLADLYADFHQRPTATPAPCAPIGQGNEKELAKSGLAVAAGTSGFAAQAKPESIGVVMQSPNISNEANANTAAAINQIEAAQRSLGGAGGVQQGALGDCWFEASVATLATTPQGCQQIADMIQKNPNGTYTVTFPGDAQHPVQVTPAEVSDPRIRDSAGWARILEAAALKKYPSQIQGGGDAGLALHLLTGHDAPLVSLQNYSGDQLSDMLKTALHNGNPVVAVTVQGDPRAVDHNHAYAVIGYDAAAQTVTLLNPWGNNKETNANLPAVGQTVDGVTNLGGGEIRMSLNTFKSDYNSIAGIGVPPPQAPPPQTWQQRLTDLAPIALSVLPLII